MGLTSERLEALKEIARKIAAERCLAVYHPYAHVTLRCLRTKGHDGPHGPGDAGTAQSEALA